MKKQKAFKIIGIISYLLIILMGEMIGLPFFLWLMFTMFDFGNADQIFALLGVIGLAINFMTLHLARSLKTILLDILCFGLLISPIVRRLTSVPIEKFNYLAFIIPTVIFMLFYLLSILFSIRQHLRIQKTSI